MVLQLRHKPLSFTQFYVFILRRLDVDFNTPLATRHMPSDFPVDIVYLWVNGIDADWQAKRRHAAQKLSAHSRGAMALYGNVEGRFRDNDELRYSLRALQTFFPGHGHVYIVTDGQAPEWLHATPS